MFTTTIRLRLRFDRATSSRRPRHEQTGCCTSATTAASESCLKFFSGPTTRGPQELGSPGSFNPLYGSYTPLATAASGSAASDVLRHCDLNDI